jgi:predicted XRE-type DNA-binding protein
MKRLTKKFRSKRFRDSYVDANVRTFLAQQIRSLRGDMSQAEFAKLLATTQSVVSRFEDPSYGKFNLQTLLEIAAKLDRAVIARIVDFQTFLRFTEDMSESAMCPDGYDPELMDRMAIAHAAPATRDMVSQQLSVLTATPKQVPNRPGELLRQVQQSHLRVAAPIEREQAVPTAAGHDEAKEDSDLLLGFGLSTIAHVPSDRWSTDRGIVSH